MKEKNFYIIFFASIIILGIIIFNLFYVNKISYKTSNPSIKHPDMPTIDTVYKQEKFDSLNIDRKKNNNTNNKDYALVWCCDGSHKTGEIHCIKRKEIAKFTKEKGCKGFSSEK